jgi:hypothetical protein
MRFYSDSRLRFERQDESRNTRDASQVDSKGKTLNSFSFDSLPIDCCVYRDSRGCACALYTRHMNQPHTDTTGEHGGIDDDWAQTELGAYSR